MLFRNTSPGKRPGHKGKSSRNSRGAKQSASRMNCPFLPNLRMNDSKSSRLEKLQRPPPLASSFMEWLGIRSRING